MSKLLTILLSLLILPFISATYAFAVAPNPNGQIKSLSFRNRCETPSGSAYTAVEYSCVGQSDTSSLHVEPGTCVELANAYLIIAKTCNEAVSSPSILPSSTPTSTMTPIPTPTRTPAPTPTSIPAPSPSIPSSSIVPSSSPFCYAQQATYLSLREPCDVPDQYHYIDYRCGYDTTIKTVGDSYYCQTKQSLYDAAYFYCRKNACSYVTPAPTTSPVASAASTELTTSRPANNYLCNLGCYVTKWRTTGRNACLRACR